MNTRHLQLQTEQTPSSYNYHYYYPQNKINAFKKRANLSLSMVSLCTSKNSKRYHQSGNKSTITEKMQNSGVNKIGEVNFKKERKDNPQKRNSKSALFDSRQTRFDLNKSRHSVYTQEEVFHLEENENRQPKIEDSPVQQLKTDQSEQYIRVIIDSYEKQLSQCRKQIQRLKDTEDECIILREICLMHYEHCEKSQFKKK